MYIPGLAPPLLPMLLESVFPFEIVESTMPAPLPVPAQVPLLPVNVALPQPSSFIPFASAVLVPVLLIRVDRFEFENRKMPFPPELVPLLPMSVVLTALVR